MSIKPETEKYNGSKVDSEEIADWSWFNHSYYSFLSGTLSVFSIALLFLFRARFFVYYDCWAWLYRWYLSVIWISASVSIMHGSLACYWHKNNKSMNFKHNSIGLITLVSMFLYFLLGATGLAIMSDVRFKYVNNRD